MADQENESLDVFANVNGPSASTIRCSQFFPKISQAIDVKGLLGRVISKCLLVDSFIINITWNSE